MPGFVPRTFLPTPSGLVFLHSTVKLVYNTSMQQAKYECGHEGEVGDFYGAVWAASLTPCASCALADRDPAAPRKTVTVKNVRESSWQNLVDFCVQSDQKAGDVISDLIDRHLEDYGG